MCETKKKFTGSYTEVNPIRYIKNIFLAAGQRGCTAVQFVFLHKWWKDTTDCANTKKFNWHDPKYTGTLQKSDCCHKAKNLQEILYLTAWRQTKNWMQYFLKIQHHFVTHSDINNGNNKTTVCQWAGQNCKEILLDLSTLHVCYPFSKQTKQASLAELAGKLRGK